MTNKKFLCSLLCSALTITGNVFLLTGIVFGITSYTSNEDHLSYLIGLYSIVYGISMFALSQIDGYFRYTTLMTAGFFV